MVQPALKISYPNVFQRVAKLDPTKTLTLRNAWVNAMKARFNKFRAIVKKAILEDDCFGLIDPTSDIKRIVTQELSTKGRKAFDFSLTSDKVISFMKWLRTQEEDGILELIHMPRMGESLGEPWTNIFVKDSYERGVQRARYELGSAGYAVKSIEETGGIAAAMSNPFHVDRLSSLYLRTYSDLQGITHAMDSQISKVLAQGLADGDNPITLAKKMNYVISGMGENLGITDSIGRFIPAERRAAMLARTETIRAHAQGTLQEFKVWGAVGVNVEAEWVTAGFNVCPECLKLAKEGPYTIEKAMGMIPAHPNCFLSSRTLIYTSTGWRPIGNIEIGELVLTHKGRFRKVNALPRTYNQKPEAVRFFIQGQDNYFSVTSNHWVQVTSPGLPPHWKEAGNCTTKDQVRILAGKCKRCDSPTPYFRAYCSHRCQSLDVTDKQWADPKHRENVSRKNREANLRQYASGERDRFAVTKAANKKSREMAAKGEWVLQRPDVIEKHKKATNLPHHNRANSERMKKKNPMHDPAIVKKATDSLMKTLELHPEKRLNVRMAKHRKSGKMTWIEQRMAMLLDNLGIEYVSQYPILRYNVDFAIPSLRIVIECDGEQWHQDKDKEKDQIRQKRIEAEGWFVLRYSGAKINQCLDEIEGEISRVVMNHAGEYEFVSCNISKIEKFTVKRSKTLYNLSVEEDESYVAKGVVVHNCRCAWRAEPVGGFGLSEDVGAYGGPGSGNFGHKGRPGAVGGSAPGKGGGAGSKGGGAGTIDVKNLVSRHPGTVADSEREIQNSVRPMLDDFVKQAEKAGIGDEVKHWTGHISGDEWDRFEPPGVWRPKDQWPEFYPKNVDPNLFASSRLTRYFIQEGESPNTIPLEYFNKALNGDFGPKHQAATKAIVDLNKEVFSKVYGKTGTLYRNTDELVGNSITRKNGFSTSEWKSVSSRLSKLFGTGGEVKGLTVSKNDVLFSHRTLNAPYPEREWVVIKGVIQ